MTKKAYLGTDVSKDHLDFALLFEDQPEKFFDLKVENNSQGFKQLIKWLKEMTVDLKSLIIVMEHTGVYTLELTCFLQEKDIKFALFPGLEIKRSMGITRGKNDKVDARRIAEYSFQIRHKLKPSKLPSETLMKLKQLLGTRQLLVRNRTSLKNSLTAQKGFNKRTGLDLLSDHLTANIQALDKSIASLEAEMKKIISSCPELLASYKLIISVKGVGPIIACAMIVATNNFTSFPNARHFMSYIGVAPFDDESGQYKSKRRVSKLANRVLKGLLHSGASSVITHDAEMRAYYHRKIAEGKQDRQVKNAIVAKIVARVFAVVKRGTHYVITYEQKILPKKVA